MAWIRWCGWSKSLTCNTHININRTFTTTKDTHLRRVLFNVPGSDQRKLQKATGLPLDCVVLDLEDGVAINQKEAARTTVLEALRTMQFGRAERLVRINPIGSPEVKEDLHKCIKPLVTEKILDAIVLPKVESPSHLETLDSFLRQCGDNDNIKILAAIESARALVDLKDICKAGGPRLEALIVLNLDQLFPY